MPVHYVYLVISVVSEVIGTSALQASEQFSKFWPSMLVIAGFGGSFFFLTLTLKYMPIGITYALASSLGIIAVAVVGLFLFEQTLDWAAILGLSFIVIGIVIINLVSTTAVH